MGATTAHRPKYVFETATKEKSKARVALVGPAGSGKTYTALSIAQGLAPEGRIALIDTERKTAKKYADKFKFGVVELESFHPMNYVEAIRAAEAAGFDVIIIDSLSHAWDGKEGLLEQVDQIAARTRNPNTFAAWKDATPMQHELVDTMLSVNAHVIVTMRVKTEWVMEENDKGKKVPRKVGLQPVQRQGIEYEFDVVGDMDDAKLVVSKSRCSTLSKAVVQDPGAAFGAKLREWLTDGSEAPVRVRKPEPEMVEEPLDEPHAPLPVTQRPIAVPTPTPAPIRQAPTPAAGTGDFQLRARRVYISKRLPTAQFTAWVGTILGAPKESKDWTPAELEKLESVCGLRPQAVAAPAIAEADVPF